MKLIILTKKYKANHYEMYNIFFGIVFEIMKFQREKHSIVRYWKYHPWKIPRAQKSFERIIIQIHNEFIAQNYAYLNKSAGLSNPLILDRVKNRESIGPAGKNTETNGYNLLVPSPGTLRY